MLTGRVDVLGYCYVIVNLFLASVSGFYLNLLNVIVPFGHCWSMTLGIDNLSWVGQCLQMVLCNSDPISCLDEPATVCHWGTLLFHLAAWKVSYTFLCPSMDRLFIYVKKWSHHGQKLKKRPNVPRFPLHRMSQMDRCSMTKWINAT